MGLAMQSLSAILQSSSDIDVYFPQIYDAESSSVLDQ